MSGWKIDIKSHGQLEEMGFAFDEYEDSDVTPDEAAVEEEVAVREESEVENADA